MRKTTLTLLFFLLFFVSSAIGGYLDGGLYASQYCASNGIDEECLRLMEIAN